MAATLTLNNNLNGIELKFDSKPSVEVLNSIKELGFRWHNKKKLWYAKQTADRLAKAKELADGKISKAAKAKAEPKEKVNKYGVKVGDLFYCSWGYEQTNVDFFQVIALVGESSVRIREVAPKRISDNPTCGMAADRTYEVPTEILPPCRSVFVEDNENGDLKRVRQGYKDQVCITVGKKGGYQTNAYPYNGQEVYESWYY